MKETIKNIKGNPITTNTGLATGISLLVLTALKLFKIDLGEMAGVDGEYIMLGLTSLISAVINLIARDPKKNEVPKQD